MAGPGACSLILPRRVKLLLVFFISFLLKQEKEPVIVVDIGSILVGDMGRRWSCLEGDEKNRFLQMAEVDRKRYKKMMLSRRNQVARS